jgi:methionine--tRNA ligase beta chain
VAKHSTKRLREKLTEQPKASGEPTGTEVVPEVTFDEFKKIDIRVAKVVEVTRIPNSARLLKLSLDIGGIKKQCIAGVGAKYEPEQLKDKLIAVVMNLKSRPIMGMMSEVMLLAAADGPELSVLTSDRSINSGSKVT